MSMIVALIKMFFKSQSTSATTASNAFNRTAEDWGSALAEDVTTDKAAVEASVECTLPDGKVVTFVTTQGYQSFYKNKKPN